MIPELPITMLACARLGIVHSVVFGGFSGEACGLRAADSGSRVLIYADSYYRNGKKIDHKGNADIAVATAKKEGQDIDKVLIWRRYAGHNTSEAPVIMGRDFFVDEILKDFTGQTIEPVSQDADAPLFLMYTSGTTGKPKGIVHTTGGYLHTSPAPPGTTRPSSRGRYWCMADIGWTPAIPTSFMARLL
jgi:acetyl-CoA synthetase